MKAIIRSSNKPGGICMVEKPVPIIGDDDVLIKVMAAGICGTDLHTYRGEPTSPAVGVTLGHEFSGIIVRTGKHVSHFSVNDRVVSDNTGGICGICPACARGEYLLCRNRSGLGSKVDGGFAEYVRISGDTLSRFPHCLLKIPESMSFAEAAVLEPFANAYNAVVQQGNIKAGDVIAIYGVGTFGLACCEIARIAGASYIYMFDRRTTSQLYRSQAICAGADQLMHSDDKGLIDRILAETDGNGVDLIIDTVGSNLLFSQSIDIIRYGGKIIKVGYDWSPLNNSFVNLINRNIALIGHMGYNATSWIKVLALYREEKLEIKKYARVRIPFEDYKKGVELLLRRQAVKVVLTFEYAENTL